MTRIKIVLDIEGDEVDAFYVVDALLDVGVPQDAINEHELDAGKLRVTSAVCEFADSRVDERVQRADATRQWKMARRLSPQRPDRERPALPLELVREICAGHLAEVAWERAAARAREREPLLRVSYFLSPDPEVKPIHGDTWEAPSVEDKLIAARVLVTASKSIETSSTFTVPAAVAQHAAAARQARALMAVVFRAGAELLR